jgi:aryl-alcohol dehydrogenase-like predicted oxidoreductase
MRRGILPGTALDSSALGLGTWGLAGPNTIGTITMGWKPIARSVREATVRAAVEAGISFFDTADIYGRGAAEDLLGGLLPGLAPDALVETKVGLLPETTGNGADVRRLYSHEHITRSLDASLRRLRRSHVDLYLLHGPPVEVLRDGDAWEALERVVEAGKVRHAGVSLSSGTASEALDVVLEVPFVRVVQLKYSLAHLEAAQHARRASAAGRAVVARVPFGHGVLLGKYADRTEFAPEDHRRRRLSVEWIARARRFHSRLRSTMPERAVNPVEIPLVWLLGDPAVSVTICGATDPSQVRGIAEAARRPPLSHDERVLVERIAEECFAPDRVGTAGT